MANVSLLEPRMDTMAATSSVVVGIRIQDGFRSPQDVDQYSVCAVVYWGWKRVCISIEVVLPTRSHVPCCAVAAAAIAATAVARLLRMLNRGIVVAFLLPSDYYFVALFEKFRESDVPEGDRATGLLECRQRFRGPPPLLYLHLHLTHAPTPGHILHPLTYPTLRDHPLR